MTDMPPTPRTQENIPPIQPAAPEVPALESFTPSEQRIIGCIACIDNIPTFDSSERRLFPRTVAQCLGISISTVESTFTKFKREQYLRGAASGGTQTRGCEFTPTGGQLFSRDRAPANCTMNRTGIAPEKSEERAKPQAKNLTPKTSLQHAIAALPPMHFKNGAELLQHLERAPTPRGNITQLQLIIRSLQSRIERSVPRTHRLDPDDVLQEVLMAVGQTKTDLAFPSEAMAFMHGIAAYKIADAFRNAKKKPAFALDELSEKEGFEVIDEAALSEVRIAEKIEVRSLLLDSFLENPNFNDLEKAIIVTITFGSSDPKSRGDYARLAAQFSVRVANVRLVRSRLLERLRKDPELAALWKGE